MSETTQALLDALGEQRHTGALAGTWVLDGARSSVRLKTRAMWGMVPVKGTFAQISGAAQVSTTGGVTASIDVASASINTKIKKRDVHLRSADFFDAERFPNITVEIHAVTGSGDDLLATGSLTARGTSVPVTLPLVINSLSETTLGVETTLTVDRSQLGMGFTARGATKLDNVLTVSAIFSRS